jgi:hypothetical protein
MAYLMSGSLFFPSAFYLLIVCPRHRTYASARLLKWGPEKKRTSDREAGSASRIREGSFRRGYARRRLLTGRTAVVAQVDIDH